jgi:bile acid:Na+ symporter, BASS family
MPSKTRSHFQTLLLLLVAYALAAWLPALGNWLRSFRISPWGLCPGIQIQHAMLALMLLCAGLGSTPAGLRNTLQNGGKVIGITALSWLLPAFAGVLVVVLLGWIPGIPIEVRLAVLIVSAMPVANSTAGWANQISANIPLSLAVLIAATALSPVITAPIINLGLFVTGLKQSGVDALPAWGSDMSMFFALWVFVPIAIGVLLSQLLSASRLSKLQPLSTHLSLAMLLLLNYVNGTVCLPGLIVEPGQFFQPLLAAGLLISSIVGVFVLLKFIQFRIAGKHAVTSPELAITSNSNSSPVGSSTESSDPVSCGSSSVSERGNPSDELTLLLAVVMRNTGAAMVYTSTALASVPLVGLVVLFYTVMQHLLIGAVVGMPRAASRSTSR